MIHVRTFLTSLKLSTDNNCNINEQECTEIIDNDITGILNKLNNGNYLNMEANDKEMLDCIQHLFKDDKFFKKYDLKYEESHLENYEFNKSLRYNLRLEKLITELYVGETQRTSLSHIVRALEKNNSTRTSLINMIYVLREASTVLHQYPDIVNIPKISEITRLDNENILIRNNFRKSRPTGKINEIIHIKRSDRQSTIKEILNCLILLFYTSSRFTIEDFSLNVKIRALILEYISVIRANNYNNVNIHAHRYIVRLLNLINVEYKDNVEQDKMSYEDFEKYIFNTILISTNIIYKTFLVFIFGQFYLHTDEETFRKDWCLLDQSLVDYSTRYILLK